MSENITLNLDELLQNAQKQINEMLQSEAKVIEDEIKKLKDSFTTVKVSVKAKLKSEKTLVGIYKKWEYIIVELHNSLEWAELPHGVSPYAIEFTLKILREHKWIDVVISGEQGSILVGAYRSDLISLLAYAHQ
jgi:hypothetical protein